MNSAVMTLDDLDKMRARIGSLPVDLSDERIATKGPRLWDGFMVALVAQANEDEEHRNRWMGFDIGYMYADVRHPVHAFGNVSTRSIGRLMVMSLSRHSGEIMLLGSLPITLGGSTEFYCRASSDDYAAVLRMVARTII